MRIMVIGAGPAGATVAETVRQYDKEAEIELFSSEPFPPYAPPAIVDYFLTGQETHLWKGNDFPQRLGLGWHPRRSVAQVRPDSKEVVTEDGLTFGYDKLVIASGSRLYAPIEGADKPGIYNLKSLSAAEELLKRVKAKMARSALIVGAGFIGVEIALLLSEMGLEVVQMEALDRVMPRMLDPETAEIALGILQQRGVDVRLNTKAMAFLGEDRAQAVELESGETVLADLIIAATGVKPNIEFLGGSGVETDWGVKVDDYLQTSIADIYAAGDVAETKGRYAGERYAHAIFPNAVAQGQVAAYNLLGFDLPYEGAESMNSLKHLGLPIVAVGAMEGDEVLRARRGETLRKVYLKDNQIVGFRLVANLGAAGVLRSLMIRRANVEPIKDRLLEPNFGVGYLYSVSQSAELSTQLSASGSTRRKAPSV
jgi:nitrite reductase (NADH) large subunit